MPAENLAQGSLTVTALDSALRVIPADIVNVDGLSISGLSLHRQLRIAFAKAKAYDLDRHTMEVLRQKAEHMESVLEQALDAMDPSQLHPEGDSERDQLRRVYNIVYEGLGRHEEPHEPEMTWAEHQALYGDE